MAEFGDVELHRAEEPDIEPQRGPLWIRMVIGLLIGVLIGGGYLYWRSRTPPAPQEVRAESEPPAATAPAPVTDTQPAIDLPPLDSSDGVMREFLQALSSHPQLKAWLATDQLARRLTAALENLASGRSPKAHLALMAPASPFRVQQAGARLVIDPASYRRYDTMADVVASVDAQACATAFRTLEPLLGAAYRELGQPGDVRAAAARTIQMVLATPVIDGPVEVRQGQVLYEFQDPALESRSAAEKHLLRMGPRNLRLLQAKARDVAHALGLDTTTE